ncbi:MAG: ribonuclease Z [Salinivirgaceae bacterium]|nr:MAG: ribonuclease Z [Salinivirgaceae bacterium]
MRFELTILGSGSALPTSNRNTTAQVLNVLERFFLLDCGEGTQHQLRKFKVSFNQIGHILISHLHGDHFFGLFGLISTMSLVGRERPLHIYGPKELEDILSHVLKPQFDKPPFPIVFHSLPEDEIGIIYEDKVVTVTAFPLRHSIPVWGFKFSEKPRLRKIIPEKIEEYSISIPEINSVKSGEHLERDGDIISNADLTTNPLSPRSYVFMTDTLIMKKYMDILKGSQVLYHEATFLHEDVKLARKTMHTTAKQAAELAKEAQIENLLLGHFSTRYKSDQLFLDEAKAVFPNTTLAIDGLVMSWPENNSEFSIKMSSSAKE